MQNTIAPPPTTETPQAAWWPKLFIVAACLVVALGLLLVFRQPDSYSRSVLALTGNPARGESLFELNCAGCHGSGGVGLVGPSLQKVATRRSDISLIQQVTSGKTLPMPQFQPDPQEMADLLSYLKSL